LEFSEFWETSGGAEFYALFDGIENGFFVPFYKRAMPHKVARVDWESSRTAFISLCTIIWRFHLLDALTILTSLYTLTILTGY